MQSSKNKVEPNVPFYTTGIWLWLSVLAALLAIAGSIVALSVPSIYAGLTPAFLPQALAQDIANLAIVAPAWLVLLGLLSWLLSTVRPRAVSTDTIR
jgi:hypothetical protein